MRSVILLDTACAFLLESKTAVFNCNALILIEHKVYIHIKLGTYTLAFSHLIKARVVSAGLSPLPQLR